MPIEVGDHPHRMRQARTVLEGRPALVVHEHEGHGLGRVAHAQGGDEGLQQLGLTRTSRPGHQGMRPVGAHIQPELPLGVLPDDRPRRAAAPLPGLQDGVGTGLGQGQHVQQPRGRGDRGVRPGGGDVVDRRQRPGHPLAPTVQHQVQGDPLNLILVRLGDRRRTRPGGHHGPALLGQGRALPVDADQPHPHLGAAAQHRDEARAQPQGVPAVEHHQDLLAVGAPAAAAVGGLQAPLHQVRQLADAPAHRLIVDADPRPGPHALRVAQVGQPPRPGPALLGPLAAHRLHQEHHLQLGRRVQHRGLGRQPGRHLMAPLPAHADHADATQGHGHGNVRGRPAQRLLVLGARGVVHLDVAGQVRDPHPQVQPVRVRGAPLPQLGPRPGGAQQQLGRVRGVRAPQPALLGQRLEGRVLGLVALLLVLAQVLPVVLPVVGAPLDQVGDHHDRGEQHEHEGVDAPSDQVHSTPHDQRGEHHGEREGRLARLRGLARQRELGDPDRAGQARGPVEVDRRRPRGRGGHGVGGGHVLEHQQALPHRENRLLRPGGRPLERASVQLQEVALTVGFQDLASAEDPLRALVLALALGAPLLPATTALGRRLILLRGQHEWPR